MTEQVSRINYSPEEEIFLKAKVSKLTDSEYNELMPMWGMKSGDLNLEQAEAMIYAAKNPDEVE